MRWIHRTEVSPVLRGACAAASLALLASGLVLAQDEGAHSPHHGPPVAAGKTGPARYVGPLLEAFDIEAAMKDVMFFDRGYRAPGDPTYEAALIRIADRLRSVGFGRDPRLKLRFLETPTAQPVWIPKSASVILRRAEGTPPEVLHAFVRPEGRDRTMLPIHAPSADVEGRPVFQLSDIEPGTIFVSRGRMSQSILRRARKRGAVAVLSSYLFSFAEDPTGRRRHEDAILFTKVAPGTSFPVAQISPRAQARIEEVVDEGDVFVSFTADVAFGDSMIRTLVAEIVGAQRPEDAVAVVSHAQEPGAGDNASGIAGLTESVVAYAGLLEKRELPWPDRSLAFVWGDEIHQTEAFLEATTRNVIAGISADMLGQSKIETGAIMLLERSPDPGALLPLAPDEHTPWGAGEVLPEDLLPNGLSVIARTAFHDVCQVSGEWTTSENPWEGGSDHDVFLEHDIPGVLLWHFTDFSYHTSADRMEMLDPFELERSSVAVLATALATACAQADDLQRYLATNDLERALRVRIAQQAGEDESAARWEEWCDGVGDWLTTLCSPSAGR